jgi:hypothetical protein
MCGTHSACTATQGRNDAPIGLIFRENEYREKQTPKYESMLNDFCGERTGGCSAAADAGGRPGCL